MDRYVVNFSQACVTLVGFDWLVCCDWLLDWLNLCLDWLIDGLNLALTGLLTGLRT